MGILVDETTRVVVQGITGKEGSFHAKGCKEYGTKVVAGVTPGKGGQEQDGVPVFDSVKDAVDREDANTSLIFVPPPFAADAILEAADAGIRLVVCITEGIPVRDSGAQITMEKRVITLPLPVGTPRPCRSPRSLYPDHRGNRCCDH